MNTTRAYLFGFIVLLLVGVAPRAHAQWAVIDVRGHRSADAAGRKR